MTVSYHRKTSSKIKVSIWTLASESFYVSVMKIRNEMHIDIKILFLPMIKFVKQVNIYFPISTFRFLHHYVYLPLWSRNLKNPIPTYSVQEDLSQVDLENHLFLVSSSQGPQIQIIDYLFQWCMHKIIVFMGVCVLKGLISCLYTF